MAPRSKLQDNSEPPELNQALHTATLELQYERSLRNVDVIDKDEDIRRLRVQLALLEHENDDLHRQMMHEQERADRVQRSQEDALLRSEELKMEMQRVCSELRVKTRDLESTKAETAALQNVSADSTKLLTEKLALTREIASLKPELEHLRSQAAAHQGLLSEKLSLQRELSTLQVELENEKRATQRAIAKEINVGELETEYKSQLGDLRQELSLARREHDKAQRALAKAEADLEKERQATQQAHANEGKVATSMAKYANQLEELQKRLEIEKREHEETKASLQAALAELEESIAVIEARGKENDQTNEDQMRLLQEELAKEKNERAKIEAASRAKQTEWATQKSGLDEKLNSFRTKLRSTKEQLKVAEAELQRAQASATAEVKEPVKTALKPSRKRANIHVDPDATIGTPGISRPAKRGKRSSATLPGDKSTFSITPFLNRTASIAPESPASEQSHNVEDGEIDVDIVQSIEKDATPSKLSKAAPSSDTDVPKAKALAPVSTNKANRKAPAPRKKAIVPTLEKVAEEGASENEENRAPLSTGNGQPAAQKPSLKPKLTSGRKSTALAVNFDEEPQPQPEKRKKRKLLGGAGALGKTLFDEDGDAPLKPLPGRSLFGSRAFNKGGLLGKNQLKGSFLAPEDGFTFSPLKRDRKAGLAK